MIRHLIEKNLSYVTMFSWQVDGNGGQTRQSGGRVEGYRRYHHGHSTDIADLLVIGAAEYGAIHGVI